ncbi:MAG: ferredoxin [Proteobacteria bacterium]|nr:ferredoxin [Pseudomonadota bacterium]
MMGIAAITAPKTKGMDDIDVKIVSGEKMTALSDKMESIGKRDGIAFFIRDADNIRNSIAVVLIGARKMQAGIKNCDFCDYKDCEENKKHDSYCTFNIIDVGIATGAAAETASKFHVDNRVMYSVARTANELGIFPKGIKCFTGIPVSVSSKSIYFDRK